MNKYAGIRWIIVEIIFKQALDGFQMSASHLSLFYFRDKISRYSQFQM